MFFENTFLYLLCIKAQYGMYQHSRKQQEAFFKKNVRRNLELSKR